MAAIDIRKPEKFVRFFNSYGPFKYQKRPIFYCTQVTSLNCTKVLTQKLDMPVNQIRS
jgi:hypothetical protein